MSEMTAIASYALLAAAGYLACSLLAVFTAPKARLSKAAVGLYAFLAAALGLLLGRTIFCLVRMNTLFYDEMGEPLGLAPFFDPAAGSVSIVGVLLGMVLAAPLCSRLTRKSAADLLDHAALPGLAFFVFMRLIEPLTGQGHGFPLEDSTFAFMPLASYNEWNEAWVLNVCYIEAALALLVLAVLLWLRRSIRKPGTLALYAALLFTVSQIIPEALRCDDVLYIFVFARVTHIGLAVMLFFTVLLALLRGRKRGLRPGTFWLELGLTALGIGLCIFAIYALDKITAWPTTCVYGGWALVLALMTALIGRRIYREDRAA